MPVAIVGETAPFTAPDGHLMSAPILAVPDGHERPLLSMATCVPGCPACRAGGQPYYRARKRA